MLLFSAYSSNDGTNNDSESGDLESMGEESNDHV